MLLWWLYLSFSWLYNVAACFLSDNNNNNNNNNNNAYLKDKVSRRVQYLGQKNGHTKCKVLEDCTQKHIITIINLCEFSKGFEFSYITLNIIIFYLHMGESRGRIEGVVTPSPLGSFQTWLITHPMFIVHYFSVRLSTTALLWATILVSNVLRGWVNCPLSP